MPKNDSAVVETEVTTPAAPETNVPAAEPVTDTFVVEGARVNIRGDEQGQSRYNLLLCDPDSIAKLEALGAQFGFQAANAQGQHYVAVTMDGRSAMEMRRGGGGHKALLLTGELVVIDIDANKRPLGHLTIAPGGVQRASLMNGGIVKSQVSTKETVNTRPVLGANSGLRSQRLR